MGAQGLLIRLSALAILAWSLQACCCGVPPPKPGPPGSIAGGISSPLGGQPGPLTVYAVNSDAMDVDGHARYIATHVSALAATYTLAVPPGDYKVVARLDSKPTSGAGYTFNVGCTMQQTCGGNAGNTALVRVRVESMQSVSGVDVGDWGGRESARVLWSIDSLGTLLPLNPEASPSPKSLPSRPFPTPSPDPSAESTSSAMGLTVLLPPTWGGVKEPNDNGYSNDVYVANEKVSSPLELDNAGVWLNVELGIQHGCPFPDWRYATARATVRMQGGSNHFFFEDPTPRDGPQPYTGYSVRGGEFVFGNCIEFTMTASTQSALDDNLPTFAAIVQSARFAQICTSCPTDLHPTGSVTPAV
jgi:hypothetical protein